MAYQDLSSLERASIIRNGVQRGLRTLPEIVDDYNKYSDGGGMDNNDSSPSATSSTTSTPHIAPLSKNFWDKTDEVVNNVERVTNITEPALQGGALISLAYGNIPLAAALTTAAAVNKGVNLGIDGYLTARAIYNKDWDQVTHLGIELGLGALGGKPYKNLINANAVLKKAVADRAYRTARLAIDYINKNSKRAIGLSFAPAAWDNFDDNINNALKAKQQKAEQLANSTNSSSSVPPSKLFYTPLQFSEDYSTVLTNPLTSLYDNPNIGLAPALLLYNVNKFDGISTPTLLMDNGDYEYDGDDGDDGGDEYDYNKKDDRDDNAGEFTIYDSESKPGNNVFKDLAYRIMSLSAHGSRNTEDILNAMHDLLTSSPVKVNYTGVNDLNKLMPNRNLNLLYLYGNYKNGFERIKPWDYRGHDYSPFLNKDVFHRIGMKLDPLTYSVKNYYGYISPYTLVELPRSVLPLFDYLAKNDLGNYADNFADSYRYGDSPNSKVHLLDDVGSYREGVGYDNHGNPEFLLSDLWDFGIGHSKYGHDDEKTEQQNKLSEALVGLEGLALESVGHPFMLRQYIPIKWSDDPNVNKTGVDTIYDIANNNHVMLYDLDSGTYSPLTPMPELYVTPVGNEYTDEDYLLKIDPNFEKTSPVIDSLILQDLYNGFDGSEPIKTNQYDGVSTPSQQMDKSGNQLNWPGLKSVLYNEYPDTTFNLGAGIETITPRQVAELYGDDDPNRLEWNRTLFENEEGLLDSILNPFPGQNTIYYNPNADRMTEDVKALDALHIMHDNPVYEELFDKFKEGLKEEPRFLRQSAEDEFGKRGISVVNKYINNRHLDPEEQGVLKASVDAVLRNLFAPNYLRNVPHGYANPYKFNDSNTANLNNIRTYLESFVLPEVKITPSSFRSSLEEDDQSLPF